METVTYLSLLPDIIIADIIVSLIQQSTDFTQVYRFTSAIPRLTFLIERGVITNYLIKKYLPKDLSHIILLYKYGKTLRGTDYFMAFSALYHRSLAMINSVSDYILLHLDMYYNYNTRIIYADRRTLLDLESIESLHNISKNYKYFYDVVTTSGIDISRLGINFDFYEVEETIRGIYSIPILGTYTSRELCIYVKNGQLPRDYIINKEFEYIGESYDFSPYYLFILGMILLSKGIDLDIQNNGHLFTFILFIMDNELFNFLFEKLREKLSESKKILIINDYK